MTFFRIVASFLLIFTTTAYAQTSRELLSEALKTSNFLNSNITVEKKLEAFEKIQSIVDQIINEHGASDEGIALLSGQKIGNFDYSKIQQSYIKELTSYYDTVCKVTPSFKCIAFVSLDQGAKTCQTAKSFDSLDSGHRELMNALNIFNSQGAKIEYQTLALNSYRNCLPNSNVKANKYIQDYFASKLVSAFLKLGKTDQAKAVIQQMDDPYLKFAAVIELTKQSGKGLSKEYFERMSQYINEKMSVRANPSEEIYRWQRAQTLASLRLKTELLNQTDFTLNERLLERGFKHPTMLDFGEVSRGKTCNEYFNRQYFETAVKWVNATISAVDSLKLDRRLYKIERSLYDFRVHNIAGYLDACGKKTDGKSYGKALWGFVRLRVLDENEAEKFLNFAAVNNYNSSQIMEYLFVLDEQIPEIEKMWKEMNIAGSKRLFDEFYDFKRLVRSEKMCDSIEMLFKKFKGNSNYNKAIAYLIESPDVDRSKKYDCGDAELEMLLK